ncbi:MAG: hypothetical protein KJO05_12490 [Bacteroidia bacterium]|nr:hypothetical protein [Bacteroidia bacterium]NNF32123.1 hypothetical protein [Flavobacteriaceae bacterium]MBT8274636.1 hypothetical protein [Bacteroidia bacterium]NNJ82021.1 hypothetical protein [Flavobacteriaceae bacterium]NNK55642.1 hypothetical protein [Flavobacteriaceae bacterium]
MKRLKSTYVLVFAIVLLVSCTQDTEDNFDIDTTSSALLLNTQQPLLTDDATVHGLYIGAVLSETTDSRGKIWINIGNDGNYNALIELVSGENLTFELNPGETLQSSEYLFFEFEGTAGSFIFDTSDINQPRLRELSLFNENYFAQVVRSRSNMASVETATFSETGNPAFSGTWSLIADGSVSNPNGNNGEGITSVLVVISGEDYEDFEFDSFNATACLGNNDYVPTLNSFGVNGYIISDYQTTMFANGMTKWNLSYDPMGSTYMNYQLCDTATSGTFFWSSLDGVVTRYGEIILD